MISASTSPRACVSRTRAASSPTKAWLSATCVDGKPSIATFADMFRYRLIALTGRCWIDADFLCLCPPDLGGEDCVFARQADAVGETLVNNAVLRLPCDHPALRELNAIAEAAIDKDQRWGALGPFLLTPVLQRHGLYFRARAPKTFYPIEPEQFWKLFLPAWRERIEARLDGARLAASVERGDALERLGLLCRPAARLLPLRLFRRPRSDREIFARRDEGEALASMRGASREAPA